MNHNRENVQVPTCIPKSLKDDFDLLTWVSTCQKRVIDLPNGRLKDSIQAELECVLQKDSTTNCRISDLQAQIELLLKEKSELMKHQQELEHRLNLSSRPMQTNQSQEREVYILGPAWLPWLLFVLALILSWMKLHQATPN